MSLLSRASLSVGCLLYCLDFGPPAWGHFLTGFCLDERFIHSSGAKSSWFWSQPAASTPQPAASSQQPAASQPTQPASQQPRDYWNYCNISIYCNILKYIEIRLISKYFNIFKLLKYWKMLFRYIEILLKSFKLFNILKYLRKYRNMDLFQYIEIYWNIAMISTYWNLLKYCISIYFNILNYCNNFNNFNILKLWKAQYITNISPIYHQYITNISPVYPQVFPLGVWILVLQLGDIF